MPDSNLADDGTLTSSFYNTYIREQVVVTCTSATRPSGVEGRLIYETDTDLLRVYDGTAWQRVANDSGQQVQADATSVTSAANGTFAVTFPTAFALAPVVSVMARVNSTTDQYVAALVTVSATGFTARVTQNGSAWAGTFPAHWIAVGRIA